MSTRMEDQDLIFKLYVEDKKEIVEICKQTKVKMRTIYRILKSRGVVFRAKAPDEQIYIKEDKIAELVKVKLLDIKREFPDFNLDMAMDRIFSKRGIGAEKVIKCIRDPVKLEKKLVELARSKVLFILSAMRPEDLGKASLNVQIQALPILLDIAGGQYPLQPEDKQKIDPQKLVQNIIVCIKGIKKSQPLVTQQIKDELDGIQKATEEGRLPMFKAIEEGKEGK